METDWVLIGVWHSILLPFAGFVLAYVYDDINAPPLRRFPDRPFPHPRPTTPVPPYIPRRESPALPIFQGSPPE